MLIRSIGIAIPMGFATTNFVLSGTWLNVYIGLVVAGIFALI